MASPLNLNIKWSPTESQGLEVNKSTFVHGDNSKGKFITTAQSQLTRKSLENVHELESSNGFTPLTDENITVNPQEIMDFNSREQRKANGRLVALIVAFLVIFMAVCHAWIRKTAALAGMLVPAGIMLSYGACVVILAKRDKHKRAMFARHIEEVALQSKCELDKKHPKKKYLQANKQNASCRASSNLQYVNEHVPDVEHPKKQRRHRQRQRDHEVNLAELGLTADAKVHQSGVKRLSFRQKLLGQTVAHVKFLELQCDSGDANDINSPQLLTVSRLDTMTMRGVKRLSSTP